MHQSISLEVCSSCGFEAKPRLDLGGHCMRRCKHNRQQATANTLHQPQQHRVIILVLIVAAFGCRVSVLLPFVLVDLHAVETLHTVAITTL